MSIPKKNIFVNFRAVNKVGYLGYKNEAYQLDEVGIRIWEAIDGASSIEQIAEQIAAHYQANISVVQRDIEDFIFDLRENQLVE
ncbi:PqqD family protein [Paenibacillus sp. NPDC058177]|uniref:PqqD family protein n=1 Tax=Paenibacillus sp. NPDC058177 TaxID=3346369 RepID=UPI0036DB1865